eukprot:07082.XXX_393586_393819_1 [CDS] Oithona nana genome sequencing.
MINGSSIKYRALACFLRQSGGTYFDRKSRTFGCKLNGMINILGKITRLVSRLLSISRISSSKPSMSAMPAKCFKSQS